MDPLTGVALAKVGVAAVQQVWNYFAGQSAMSVEKERLAKKRGFLDQQRGQAVEQINRQAGAEAAAMAQNGVIGVQNDINVAEAKDERTKALELQYQQSLNSLDNASADLQSSADQFGMDTLMGSLGIGLSAASVMVKGGLFGKPKAPGDGTNPSADPKFDPFDVGTWNLGF